MKRWLPSPLTSLLLLTVWLMLNQSLAPIDWLIGATLGFSIPALVRPLQPHGYAHIARPFALVRLLWLSLIEIIRSCFNVATIILFRRTQGVNAQFIRIPLDLHDPHGLALLSCLINTTPGTVWVEILPDKHELLLHIFDLHDEEWWIRTIKRSYEQPIIEIYQQPRTRTGGKSDER